MKHILLATIVAMAPALAAAHTVGQAGDNVATGHENATVALGKNRSQGVVGFHPNTTKAGKPSE